MLNRLLPVLFVSLIACGGGGSPTPVPLDTNTPDPDSPAALACPPMGPLMGAVGTAAKPVGVPAAGCVPGGAPPNGCAACGADGNTPCDWYTAPTMGPNTGVEEFAFITGIQGTMDQLQFHVATPIAINTDIPWETNGASMAQYAALTIYLQSQNGQNVDRVLFPTSGTVKVTESSTAPNGKTTATVAPTSYAELDDAGAVLAGGCTVQLSSLTLFLQQGSATFQKPNTPDDGSGRPWAAIMPVEYFGKLLPR